MSWVSATCVSAAQDRGLSALGAGGAGGAPPVSCSWSSRAGGTGLPGDAVLVPAGQTGAVLTPGWISGSSCLCLPQVSAAPHWGAVPVGEPVRASFCCLPLGHRPGLTHPSLFVNTLWLPSSSSSSPLWVGTRSRPAARAGAGTASPLLAQGHPAWAPSAMGTRRRWGRGVTEKVLRLESPLRSPSPAQAPSGAPGKEGMPLAEPRGSVTLVPY